jgi:DNA-binding SARP family transcriptional activator/predicted ATPase/biotin operon repressor
MNGIPAPSSTRHIWAFGSLRLREGDGPNQTIGGKALSLLAYLLIHHDTPQPREIVAEALWPDSEPAQSRRHLSDTLYRLRQTIGEGWLLVDRERLSLRIEEGLWVDAWRFEQLAQTDDPSGWEQAAALYKGDFLPELYEDWALPSQVRLRELYITCLDRLARDAEENGRFSTAHTYYRQLIQQDSLREDGYRGLMRCLAGLGRLTEALDVYHKLVDFLAQEMDVQPATSTRYLGEQIERDWQQSRRAGSHVQQSPFIGRSAERTLLLTHLDQARRGQGGLAVVLGEAGMGKTRLLQELVKAAEWRGWRILWGQSEEFTLPATYAPLIQALTTVSRPRWQQLKQLVEPFWLSLVANLIPGLSQTLKLPVPSGLEDAHKQLPQAIARVLLGLQEIAPHLILLDDVQWGDPGLWPLLDSLQPVLNEAALFLVISGRSESLRNQDVAWSKLEAWDRQGRPLIHLEGLSSTALAELAAAQNKSVSPQQLQQLHQASGGNPLFVQTLLATEENWGNLAKRPSLTQLIQKRLDNLGPGHRLALQAASVIGYQFDYATWTAVLGDMNEPLLPTLASELEQEGLLVLEKESYRFAHDTLRACLYQEMSADRQEALHRQILNVLTNSERPDPLICLHHAQQLDDAEAIACFAVRAGREAAAAFNQQAALGYFSQALAAVENGSALWAKAVNGRIQAAIILARHEEVAAEAQSFLTWARQRGTAVQQARAFFYCANIAWMTGQQVEAQEQAQTGLKLIRQTGVAGDDMEARLLETLSRIARDQGDARTCQQWVEEALTHYRAGGNRLGEASALDKLANLRFEAGDYQQAAEQHRQAATDFRQMGATLYEGRALNGLALALRYLGQYDEAQTIHERCLAIARQFQDRYGEWTHLVNLGNISYELGDFESAVARYEEALTIPKQLQAPRGVSITLNNLGQARRGQERFETALASFDEALQINREHGFRSGEGHALNGRGLTLVEAEQFEAAVATLTPAVAIWRELGDRLRLLDALASLALAQIGLEQTAVARQTVEEALAAVQPSDSVLTRRLVYYAAYRLFDALGEKKTAVFHLQQAEQIRRETAEILTPEQCQFFARIPLNRQIETAVAGLSQTKIVSLVRGDVPLGRRLTPNDYVTVTWTVYQPQDDAFPVSSTERRRHVLLRLAAEAQAQGAVATDSDLAQTLGVSRRTILRDVQVLTETGHTFPTRRRQ